MKILVLDGNSLVNRAFFGIKLLTTKDGRFTNAIYGFQNILLNLLAAHQPDAVAIAWDEKAPTFRHTAYDGYKATRHGMPEELAGQMPVLKALLGDLGFVQVSKPGWEADDGRPLTAKTRAHMFALFAEAGIADADAQRRGMAAVLGHPVESRGGITESEGQRVVQSLISRKDHRS